jgi:hypothetical protein
MCVLPVVVGRDEVPRGVAAGMASQPHLSTTAQHSLGSAEGVKIFRIQDGE